MTKEEQPGNGDLVFLDSFPGPIYIYDTDCASDLLQLYWIWHFLHADAETDSCK